MSSYLRRRDTCSWNIAATKMEGRIIGHLAEAEMDRVVAHRLPHLLREKQLRWNESDKIFTSQWLSENNVLVGTKCNKVHWRHWLGFPI